jgi:hypothetical protein
MAEENRTDAAAEDLRRRQEEEAGGVIVDGPAGAAGTTVAPIEPPAGPGHVPTSIAQPDQPDAAHPAAAAASQAAASAASKPKAVPVTELALTYPAQMQAKAEAEKAAAAADAIEAARHAELERQLRQNSETAYERAVMDAAARLAQDDGRANYLTRAASGRGMSVRELAPDFVGAVPNREEAIAAKKREIRATAEAERRKLEDAVGDTETGIYVGPDEEGKKFLKQMNNDSRFNRLRYDEMTANEVERWWRTRESSGAIDRLKAIDSNWARVNAVTAKMERGEKLNQQEDYIRQGMHLWPQHLIRKTNEALGDLVAAEVRRAQIPESPALRKLNEADTVGDVLKVLLNNPLQIMAVKAGQAIPKTIASATATLLGGPFGGILASAYVVFGSEYAGAVLKGFEDEGIDLQNESAVLEAIKKKDMMERIYDKAFVVAGIASMAEVASGAVGNIRIAPFQSKMVEKGAQMAVQADIAVTAKKATDKALGKETSKGERSEAVLDGVLGALMPDIEKLAF